MLSMMTTYLFGKALFYIIYMMSIFFLPDDKLQVYIVLAH